MLNPDETDGLSDFRAALEAQGGGMRSPLFQWMYRNHDALLEMLSEVRPNWQRVTAVLSERGFTGPDGRPLRRETVRKLWLRVRRRHGRAQAGTEPRFVAKPVTGAPAVVTKQTTPESSNADEVLARFRAKIDERSGRKP
ncbi:hypothetical protein [Skermanella aerolata]|nr:hypothetical protein [Skermanella aerolata]KJB91249.1 hypothetical protein N826_31470 [Skermanella aerolata KACC 11604]